MSHHRDQSAAVDDDGRLVPPYIPAGGHSGPAGSWLPSVPEPTEPDPDPGRPAPRSARPTAAGAPAGRASHRRAVRSRRGPRTPLMIIGVLGVAATAGLLLLLRSPETERPKASPPPLTGVPGLPGGGGVADGSEAPADTAAGTLTGPAATPSAVRPSASAATTPSAKPSPGTGQTSAQPTPSPVRPERTDGTLRTGDSGPEVSELQQALFGQGFTYVSVTGRYDEATKRGVRQFQRDRSLRGDPSGVFGPHTRAALYG
ncbi:peptidoglycan-binding protein [Streptomyces sp. NPDC051211]|uniref:peptidoglycan-binding domain-containing protein n=1 Tax=Streptomyces sp. NPDC051211 TaxID=3154643 RepID=UPI00344C067F